MAEPIKIYPDTAGTLEASNCGFCYGYTPISAILTPCKLTYTAKVTLYTTTKPTYYTDRIYLNSEQLVSYKIELQSLDTIADGAWNKDAYKEFKEYYNSIKDPSAPPMDDNTATTMLKRLSQEIQKKEYKSALEQAIKNNLNPIVSRNKTTHDLVQAELMRSGMSKAISYDAWQSFDKTSFTYQGKVDLGVNPKFMAACSNITDKSRLSVSEPAEKLCASFVAGINKDKTDDIFSVYAKEYAGQNDAKFTGGGLGILAQGNNPSLWQEGWSRTTRELMVNAATQEMRAAVADGVALGDSGVRMKYDGNNFDVYTEGHLSFMVESSVQNDGDDSFKARQNIWGAVVFKLGANSQTQGAITVKVGGKYLSLGQGFKTAFRCLKNATEMVVQAFEKSHEKGAAVVQEVAVTKTNAAATDSAATTAKTQVSTAVAAVQAAAASGDPAAVASAKVAVAQAQTATDALEQKNNDLKNGTGGTSVTGDVNETAGSQVIPKAQQDLASAGNALNQNPPNLTQAIEKVSSAQDNISTAKVAASEINKGATDLNRGVNETVTKGNAGPNDVKQVAEWAAGQLKNTEYDKLNQRLGETVERAQKANQDHYESTVNKFITPSLTPTTPAVPQYKVNPTDLEPNTPNTPKTPTPLFYSDVEGKGQTSTLSQQLGESTVLNDLPTRGSPLGMPVPNPNRESPSSMPTDGNAEGTWIKILQGTENLKVLLLPTETTDEQIIQNAKNAGQTFP